MLVYALYKFLNKVVIRMFEFVFHFLFHIKISELRIWSYINDFNTKKAFFDSSERLKSLKRDYNKNGTHPSGMWGC